MVKATLFLILFLTCSCLGGDQYYQERPRYIMPGVFSFQPPSVVQPAELTPQYDYFSNDIEPDYWPQYQTSSSYKKYNKNQYRKKKYYKKPKKKVKRKKKKVKRKKKKVKKRYNKKKYKKKKKWRY